MVMREQGGHPWMGNSLARAEAADAGRDRRRLRSRSCSSRSRRTIACESRSTCRSASDRKRALRRHLTDMLSKNENARRTSQFPRRRLLAASRAGGGRRDRRADRVPDPRLGLAAIGLRTQPGLVRICEPARRAAQHGCGEPAGLFLGLRHRPCHPHGVAHDRPARGDHRRGLRSRTPVGGRELLRAGRHAGPHQDRAREGRSEDRPDRSRRSQDEGLVQDRRRLFRDAVLSRPVRDQCRGDRAHRRGSTAPRRSSASIR